MHQLPLLRTGALQDATTIAALAVKRGDADAMLCGLQGRYIKHVRDIRSVLDEVIQLSGGYYFGKAYIVLPRERDRYLLAAFFTLRPSE